MWNSHLRLVEITSLHNTFSVNSLTFDDNSQLMIGRFLCGLSAGCYSYIIPIYIGEISSDEYRGAMLSIFQVGLNLGIFFVFTVGHFASIRILNIICGIIPILFSLGFLGLPESPALLISQNRETNAMKSLEKLRGGFEDVESELEALKIRNEQVRAQAKTFNEVFKTRSTLKAFLIIMLQFFFFQMTGINVVYLYATTIFTEAGISLDAGLASITVVGVQVVATFIAVGLVDRFGRKIMLSFSNCLMGLGLVAIGTYFTLKDSGTPVDSLGWLPLTSLCIYVIAFSSGMGPVSYILLGEFFLQDAKAFVAPISQVFNFLLLFTISLTFPMLTSSIGNGLTFFIFAGFCALSMLFTIFFIPETKGKSVSEIQNILR